MTDGAPRERRRIAASATAAVAGIAISVVGYETLGGYVTVFAVVALIWSVHRYGRTGAS